MQNLYLLPDTCSVLLPLNKSKYLEILIKLNEHFESYFFTCEINNIISSHP